MILYDGSFDNLVFVFTPSLKGKVIMLATAIASLTVSLIFTLLVAYYTDPKDSSELNKKSMSVLLTISMVLTIILAYTASHYGLSQGQHHLLTNSDLEQGVFYETVSEPISHKPNQGPTLDYVFLSKNGGDPKAYSLDYNHPPQRFIVIINGRGQTDILARPLPKKNKANTSMGTEPEPQ